MKIFNGHLRRRLAPLLAVVLVAALVGLPAVGRGGAVAPAVVPQPWLGVIDNGGTLIDASPGEEPGEVWSMGEKRLLRYTEGGGWTAMPSPLDAEGKPIELAFAAGRATPGGSVALLANGKLFVRDPGGNLREAPAAEQETAPAEAASEEETGSGAEPGLAPAEPAAEEPGLPLEPPLHKGEQLYESNPLLAPLEVEGRAGAFVVPTAGADGVRDAVLRFNGTAWDREPICLGLAPACERPPVAFTVDAIDAAGSEHAWLLATGTATTAGVVLLHRVVEPTGPVWRPVSLGSSPFALRSPEDPGGPALRIAPRTNGQPLVATSQGVWADASVTAGAITADATVFYGEAAGGVLGSWCEVGLASGAELCTHPLGAVLGGESRSFAWADGSTFGTRIITGLSQGAMLRLNGETFERIPGGGRGAGTSRGAAFASPENGWLGAFPGPIRYGVNPQPSRLRLWPLPFRHPLTAIAAAPAQPLGAIGSEAIAVGEKGEVARFLPGQGWSPETLYNGAGTASTPRLRAVAWPTPEAAFAVGDGGEMWRWRKATELWEPDPAKPPTIAVATADFTGLAFDPDDPDRGYAIGKQGVLLAYGKQWMQEALPSGLADANFTSIAFAGDEALVTYKVPVLYPTGYGYRGGLIVNDGSGWREEPALSGALPKPGEPGHGFVVNGAGATPQRVAGLPDGGAVVATMDGHLAERNEPGGAWIAAGLEPVGYPVALGALREGAEVRAVISVAPEYHGAADLATDEEVLVNPPPSGQAPSILDPYPVPSEGYVLRQVASGWEDEEHSAWPTDGDSSPNYDLPEKPDPVLAFLTDPSGAAGWAVGGDPVTQTASAARFPDDGHSAPGEAGAQLVSEPTKAAFAIGGGGECLSGCADLAATGVGPWRWLPAAVSSAARIGGVRAFVDTGGGTGGAAVTDAFAGEEAGAATRLVTAAGGLPVYEAAAASDRNAADSLATFLDAYQAASQPLGGRPAAGVTDAVGPVGGAAYYAFDSTGSAGTVRVIVVDTSAGLLGETQDCWLSTELGIAATEQAPAIVIGHSQVTELGDGDEVGAILVAGAVPPGCPGPAAGAAASAYFFDSPDENRSVTISAEGAQIEAFGSGSLGYGRAPASGTLDEPPDSGFLLAQVETQKRDPATNRAPVSVTLVPNVAELALDPIDGTMLRRSQVALFEGLARRPRAGQGCLGAPQCALVPTDPYVPIPFECVGSGCDTVIPPEYKFTSSNPKVANFVEHDPAASNPRRMLFDQSGNPVPDAASGLLCAFNAGTTTVTLATGGLSYSIPVTIEPGKVRRPCGTVPLEETTASGHGEPLGVIPGEAPQPEPKGGTNPFEPPPPPGPLPTHPAHVVPPPHHVSKPLPRPFAAVLPPFVPAPTGISPLVAIVPPPPPPAAQTTPPSGTSPVTQPVTSPNPEDEEEPAVDMVQNMVAHRDPVGRRATLTAAHLGQAPSLPFPLIGGLLLMTALAATGLVAPRLRPNPARVTPGTSRRPYR